MLHVHAVHCVVKMDHPCDCADEKLKSYLLEIPDYRVILVTTQDDCTKGFVRWLVCRLICVNSCHIVIQYYLVYYGIRNINCINYRPVTSFVSTTVFLPCHTALDIYYVLYRIFIKCFCRRNKQLKN